MMLRLAFVFVTVSALAAESPSQRSEWTTSAYDIQRTGWNRAEQALSPANIGQLRRVWKTLLPNTTHVLAGLSAPLVVNHGGRTS
jgi:hypothetical protein